MILGHVDSYKGPTVFFKLRSLVAGDIVDTSLADGVTAEFKVTSLAMYLNSLTLGGFGLSPVTVRHAVSLSWRRRVPRRHRCSEGIVNVGGSNRGECSFNVGHGQTEIGLLGPPSYEPRRALTLITGGRYASSRRPACRV